MDRYFATRHTLQIYESSATCVIIAGGLEPLVDYQLSRFSSSLTQHNQHDPGTSGRSKSTLSRHSCSQPIHPRVIATPREIVSTLIQRLGRCVVNISPHPREEAPSLDAVGGLLESVIAVALQLLEGKRANRTSKDSQLSNSADPVCSFYRFGQRRLGEIKCTRVRKSYLSLVSFQPPIVLE